MFNNMNEGCRKRPFIVFMSRRHTATQGEKRQSQEQKIIIFYESNLCTHTPISESDISIIINIIIYARWTFCCVTDRNIS